MTIRHKKNALMIVVTGAVFLMNSSLWSVEQDSSENQETPKVEKVVTHGVDGRKLKVELKKHFPTKQLEKSKDVKWSHAPYNKGKCSLCHESDDLEKPGPMRASVNKICFSCHAKEKTMLEERKIIHEPALQDCGYCHNSHNSTVKSLLYKPMKELCVTCHKDQKAEMEAKVQHDPVIKEKTCQNCHDSHASDISKRLAAPEGPLCIDCHGGKKKPAKDEKGRVLANIKELQKKQFKHGPFKDNNCSECHKSHGGKHFRLLIEDYPSQFYSAYNDQKYAFCYKCHKKERITTAKTTFLTGFRNKDANLHYAHVVKPASGRTCRSCHEDHATARNHLMRVSVPYGPSGWRLEINYVETESGGNCSKTCHDNETYDNGGVRPKDVAAEYKKKREQQE